MSLNDAILIADGGMSATEEKEIEAWQLLIDTGMCWQLQGYFQRTAIHMLESGICRHPEEKAKDYKANDPEYCDCCECTPCDCDWGYNDTSK